MTGRESRFPSLRRFVDDPDFVLYVGDVRDTLSELPAESVDCCVTSPPYWGLRDYGTGKWDGGDSDCDHSTGKGTNVPQTKNPNVSFAPAGHRGADPSLCSRCGARRVDQQLGLEATPDEYVANLVAVFREVRRVLAPHGTVWLNLGDSYNAYNGGAGPGSKLSKTQTEARPQLETGYGLRAKDLKPKDLVGIPWRVALALQADGWYLRSDIVWAKPNPMPESIADRPTKAHEYVFMLAKEQRYFFDQEAVREPYRYDGRKVLDREAGNGSHENHRTNGGKRNRWPGIGWASHVARAQMAAHGHDESEPMEITHAGRNVRTVWEIATQPYPEAHFATFPLELPRRCIAAGCPEQVCGTCGKPRERIVEVESSWRSRSENGATQGNLAPEGLVGAGTQRAVHGAGVSHDLDPRRREIKGWSDCGHDAYRPGSVLDPFMGSGTTALAARNLGRKAVGVELNEDYAALCARRLSQQSLLAVS